VEKATPLDSKRVEKRTANANDSQSQEPPTAPMRHETACFSYTQKEDRIEEEKEGKSRGRHSWKGKVNAEKKISVNAP